MGRTVLVEVGVQGVFQVGQVHGLNGGAGVLQQG